MSHLLDTYCLATSSKASKPFILEKFYPLPFDKYVTFAPFSKPSKNYDLYPDVLEILHPVLKEAGIEIVQLGAANETPFLHCYHTQGKTNFNQVYSLIKNSLLYFGADTFAQHFASYLNVPSVVLISNNWANNVRGYWNRDKQIVLEPDRTKRKPSFSLDEGNNKQINEIKSENIAKAVCQLLNLPFDFPYETVYVGENYNNKILEMVPNSVTNISNLGIDSIVVRMDYEFNEEVLQHQMQHCPVTIVTNKPINLEILKVYKPRIKQLYYVVEEDNSPEFVKNVQKLSIPTAAFTYLEEEKLNKFKLKYLDLLLVQRRDQRNRQNIKELAALPPETPLYYKSAKNTLSKGSIYPSRAAWEKGLPVSTINEIAPVIEEGKFWNEAEHFIVFREK